MSMDDFRFAPTTLVFGWGFCYNTVRQTVRNGIAHSNSWVALALAVYRTEFDKLEFDEEINKERRI